LLQGEELRDAYNAADIFVLPSLQENFGIAVVEAMSAGCPVIVSEEVSLAQEIAEARAGIVCFAAVEPLAKAMAALLADVRERKAMGERGRRLVVEKFTAEKTTMDLLAVYHEILTSDRKHSAWRISS
jgi:glycosyltransferase involved in cell wall biosynthesis